MAGKIERFIATPQPSPDEVPYHNMRQAKEMLGPQYTYMANSLIPEADMSITVRYIEKVPPGFKSEDEPHRHQVSQLYTIIGDLTLELVLEDEKREINGPAAVFIPAGAMHAIYPLSGSGYLVVVTRAGKSEFFGPP